MKSKIKPNREPVSLIREEIFTLVSDEGLGLSSLENFTVGKAYKIRKESTDPKHSIGMLYTVEDDAGKIREVNSCYFTAPTPKLKEDFFTTFYINNDSKPSATVEEQIVLRDGKKKKKPKTEPVKNVEIDLEDYLKRINDTVDELDELKQLAGLPIKQKTDSLKLISRLIHSLTLNANDILRQLHELDKEIAILKKTKVRI